MYTMAMYSFNSIKCISRGVLSRYRLRCNIYIHTPLYVWELYFSESVGVVSYIDLVRVHYHRCHWLSIHLLCHCTVVQILFPSTLLYVHAIPCLYSISLLLHFIEYTDDTTGVI